MVILKYNLKFTIHSITIGALSFERYRYLENVVRRRTDQAVRGFAIVELNVRQVCSCCKIQSYIHLTIMTFDFAMVSSKLLQI